MRILALVTDGFGVSGGIGKFNRDLLEAICTHPGVTGVTAAPRLMAPGTQAPTDGAFSKLTYLTDGVNSKVRYVTTLAQHLLRDADYDLVLCGHINLLPLAWLARVRTGGDLVQIIHGSEAWQPTGSAIIDRTIRSIDAFVTVSGVTRDRFTQWTGLAPELGFVLPNSIDPSLFTPGPKNPDLLDRYGLHGKTVLLTLGRLSAAEQAKGFDEVMNVLGDLAEETPDIAYLIAGDGTDRARLEAKARDLGVADRVVFAGFIPEEEKVDHYRLADVYVMPSKGEGFGIVYLEAMACGIPVVGSSIDGSLDAIPDETFGLTVDPAQPEALKSAVRASLAKPKEIPEHLDHFSYENFSRRVHRILDTLAARSSETVVQPGEIR